jgi:hypothetical protein
VVSGVGQVKGGNDAARCASRERINNPQQVSNLPHRCFLRYRGLIMLRFAALLLLAPRLASAADYDGAGNPARVEDKATYAKPHQYSQGFDLVLVNGKIAVGVGKLSGVRPGQTVRHQ